METNITKYIVLTNFLVKKIKSNPKSKNLPVIYSPFER